MQSPSSLSESSNPANNTQQQHRQQRPFPHISKKYGEGMHGGRSDEWGSCGTEEPEDSTPLKTTIIRPMKIYENAGWLRGENLWGGNSQGQLGPHWERVGYFPHRGCLLEPLPNASV